MSRKLNRRDFVRTTTAAGVAAATASRALFAQAPAVHTGSVKPVVVASGNGNSSKDAEGVTCVQKAFTMMTQGADVLDALVAGVSIVELDPNQTGVGWSGLPNADGVVQLDACCMHGPKKRAGGVAAIEGVRAPARVAQLVARGDRSSSAGRQRRAGLRARDGHQDRGGPDQRERAQALAGVEAAHRPAALPRSRRSARRRGTTPACRWCAKG